ncbi:Endocytosis and vacuole integrity protein, partial [Cryomyces antarcticus]
MDLLESIIVQHVGDHELYDSGALLSALNSLVLPISLKYKWKLEGKTPSPWQKATTTVLATLEPALRKSVGLSMDQSHMNGIWKSIAQYAHATMSADLSVVPQTPTIFTDEAFDINAMTKLRDLVIPALGQAYIHDATRRAYTSSLFQASLIHKAGYGDIPDADTSPLTNIYTIRFGRTYDPPPSLRSRMS